LEIDWDIVEEQEKASSKKENECHSDGDGAVLEETTDDDCAFSLIVFDYTEEDHDHAEAHETGDDRTAIPGFGLSAPL
jgi:hypothetical protein